MRDDGAEVLLDQFGMILNGFAERAEDDSELAQLLFHGRSDRDAVENGVDGDAGQHFLLVQGDAELLVSLEQLGIDFVEALERLDALWRGVVDERVVVDCRIPDVAPVRLFHGEPAPVGLEAPFQHELGLVLFRRDGADYVFIEPGWDGVRLDIGDEPVRVLPVDQCLDSRAHSNSLAFLHFPS